MSFPRLLGWVFRKSARSLFTLITILSGAFCLFIIYYVAFKSKRMVKATKESSAKFQVISKNPDSTTKSSMNTSSGVVMADLVTVVSKAIPCQHVHAFYYPWYANSANDNEYLHWNHKYLPHWNPLIAKNYPNGIHVPPDDIGANFYPFLGPYSSADPNVINSHMQQLSKARVGVIAVSYYPPGIGDDNGKDWQHIFPLLLESAQNFGIKVTFHIEPYNKRDEISVKRDIINIIESYSMFPAFYKKKQDGQELPLIYIYDSYHTKATAWSLVLKKTGRESIRKTKYDAIVIGLVVEENDLMEMVQAGFDGFYTYFAADGFTFGSTKVVWPRLAAFANEHNLLYIPSVGPGYIDTRIRPWNGVNTRKRLKGKYYQNSWETALQLKPNIISITSFNEWHEGTQIEKAVPKSIDFYKYSDYNPYTPDYYLQLTKRFVKKFEMCNNDL